MKKKIRAAVLARHIGISSQDLRKILSEVNFGVKPTDREFPEELTSGIIRYAARKLKKNIPPMISYEDSDKDNNPDDLSNSDDNIAEEESVFDKLNKLGKKSQVKIDNKENLDKDQNEENKNDNNKKLETKKEEIVPKVFRKIEIAIEEDQKVGQTKAEKDQEILEKKAMLIAKKKVINLVKKSGVVEIPKTINVKEFSEKVGVPVSEIITSLLKNGVMANMNSNIDYDTFDIISDDLGVKIKKQEEVNNVEDIKSQNLQLLLNDDQENLSERPPVIVVMGHVDHGKTMILDTIRNTHVIKSESGGITQHIGAYQVEKNGKKLTFLDTPGHEAFTAMRSRGAKTADIAILVVAADEGMKPQTVEALNHAREADLPIIVAVNKIDKENANPEKVKSELANYDLSPEEWGGETSVIEISAMKNIGIDDLLDTIILQSEILELKANPNRLAIGTVIESHLDQSLGPIATILVNTGTLKIGDDFVLDGYAGKIKTMINSNGQRIKKADPSYPVLISGLEKIPTTGSILQVFKNKKQAKEKSEEYRKIADKDNDNKNSVMMNIMSSLQSGKMKYLKIILKADTEGSLEAIKQSIDKIKSSVAMPKIIHSAVGSPTENDISMASASQALIISFHSKTTARIRDFALKEKIEIRDYKIIYDLIDDIKKVLEGMLDVSVVEKQIGELLAKEIFYTKKSTAIIGCNVVSGEVKDVSYVKFFRKKQYMGSGKLTSLQQFAKKVEKITEGQDCGIQVESKFSVEPGDVVEVFIKEEVKQEL